MSGLMIRWLVFLLSYGPVALSIYFLGWGITFGVFYILGLTTLLELTIHEEPGTLSTRSA